jgi:hypothetical protein
MMRRQLEVGFPHSKSRRSYYRQNVLSKRLRELAATGLGERRRMGRR